MNANWPAPAGVLVNEVTSTEPLTRLTLPELDCALPLHVPLVNQLTLTVPVGVGLPAPPDTVTKSCTVVPATTEVTTWWLGSWICVAVDAGRFTRAVCEPV